MTAVGVDTERSPARQTVESASGKYPRTGSTRILFAGQPMLLVAPGDAPPSTRPVDPEFLSSRMAAAYYDDVLFRQTLAPWLARTGRPDRPPSGIAELAAWIRQAILQ